MEEKRTGLFENGLIWFGAGVSIAEILTGTYLAPLGMGKGLLAIIVGHIIGCLMLFLAGVIGQKALVIEEIDTLSSKGRVEVRGQEWAAKTDAPEGKIPKNAIVVVEGIQGVKLIVRNGEETKI